MQYRNRISIDRICVGAVSRMRGLHEFGKYNPFALSSKRGAAVTRLGRPQVQGVQACWINCSITG